MQQQRKQKLEAAARRKKCAGICSLLSFIVAIIVLISAANVQCQWCSGKIALVTIEEAVFLLVAMVAFFDYKNIKA